MAYRAWVIYQWKIVILFINIGILAFSLAVLFQLVTLPVEYNASARAVRIFAQTQKLLRRRLLLKKVLNAEPRAHQCGRCGIGTVACELGLTEEQQINETKTRTDENWCLEFCWR